MSDAAETRAETCHWASQLGPVLTATGLMRAESDCSGLNEEVRPSLLLAQGLSLAVPSSRRLFPGNSMAHSLLSFRSLQKCHLFQENFPDCSETRASFAVCPMTNYGFIFLPNKYHYLTSQFFLFVGGDVPHEHVRP